MPREPLKHVVRVAAEQQRVKEPAIDETVLTLRGGDVGGRRGRGPAAREVERDADARGRASGPKRSDGEAVGDQQVVGDLQRRWPVAQAGRLDSVGVGTERNAPWLVVRDPVRHDVAQSIGHRAGIAGEALGRVARRPAAAVLQRRRKVRVIQRDHRLDATLAESGCQSPVEVDALAVEPAAAVRLHARPGDREAVGLEPKRGHELEVLFPAVVVVTRDGGGGAARDRARLAAEAVPDRLAAPVLRGGALDLVGG